MPSRLLLELSAEERGRERALHEINLKELYTQRAQLLADVTRLLRQWTGSLTGSLDRLQAIWTEFCQMALRGEAAEAHEMRDRFLETVARRVASLKEALAAAQSPDAGGELPEVDVLRRELAGLERLYHKICHRWKSAEDLEDLAAESTAPTAEQFAAVRKKHGFPAAWYAQDSKPF